MPPLLFTELLEKSIISCYKRNFRVRVTIRVQTTHSEAITLDKADNFFDFLRHPKKNYDVECFWKTSRLQTREMTIFNESCRDGRKICDHFEGLNGVLQLNAVTTLRVVNYTQ